IARAGWAVRRAGSLAAARSRAGVERMSAGHDDETPPKKGLNRDLLRRVLRFARPYRRQFLVSVVLLLALAGLSLFIPLVVRHTIDHYLPSPPGKDAVATARVLDPDSAHEGVVRGAALLLVLGAVIFACRYWQLRVINQTGQRVIHDLRLAL